MASTLGQALSVTKTKIRCDGCGDVRAGRPRRRERATDAASAAPAGTWRDRGSQRTGSLQHRRQATPQQKDDSRRARPGEERAVYARARRP